MAHEEDRKEGRKESWLTEGALSEQPEEEDLAGTGGSVWKSPSPYQD